MLQGDILVGAALRIPAVSRLAGLSLRRDFSIYCSGAKRKHFQTVGSGNALRTGWWCLLEKVRTYFDENPTV